MLHTIIFASFFLIIELPELFTFGAGLVQNDVCFGFAARRKLLERARRAGLGGFKKRRGTKATVEEMWDGEEGKLIYSQVARTEF